MRTYLLITLFAGFGVFGIQMLMQHFKEQRARQQLIKWRRTYGMKEDK